MNLNIFLLKAEPLIELKRITEAKELLDSIEVWFAVMNKDLFCSLKYFALKSRISDDERKY